MTTNLKLDKIEKQDRMEPNPQHDGILAPKNKHRDNDDLDQDDHTNYHTDTRGDARYIQLDGSTVYSGTGAGFFDEDDMSSDDATATASQQSIKAYVDGAKPDWMFGDGTDGTVDVNSGSFSSGPITSNALTRDAHFTTLTLSGGNLDTAGYRLFVSGTLTVDSTYKVHRDGNAGGLGANGNNAATGSQPSGGAGGTAGAAKAAGSIKGGTPGEIGAAGGAGGLPSGDGVTGGASVNGDAVAQASIGVDGSNNSGVSGGDGGISKGYDGGVTCAQEQIGGVGTAGGNKGVATARITDPTQSLSNFTNCIDLQTDATFNPYESSGGSGNGGGAGGGVGADYGASSIYGASGAGGGGSGSSGGIVLIISKTIVNNGGISSDGGDGGDGGVGGDGGSDQAGADYGIAGAGGGGCGGAGGSGGVVMLVYQTLSGNAVTATAGSGGTGGAVGTRACVSDCCAGHAVAGENGANGTTGKTYSIII